MDYLKIQMELMKEANKRDAKNKIVHIGYGFYKDRVVLINDYYAALAPKDRCYLNLETAFRNAKTAVDVGKFFDYNAVPAKDTHTTVLYKKHKLRAFSFGKEKLYVGEDFLKAFKLDNPRYEAVNTYSPLFLFEGDQCAGFILPFNLKEEELWT